MAVLPCVNPYPRVRPALAVLVTGALVGLLLAIGGSPSSAQRPRAASTPTAPATYALNVDPRP